jgi:hypothetical protein
VTVSDFDLQAWLDDQAAQWPPQPFMPLVNRRDATALDEAGLVEGRDFDVYPDLAPGLAAVTERPPAVDDRYRYWAQPPSVPSPRCEYWLQRIEQGWRPNRRIRGMGYDEAAEWYGVYIWEYLHKIAPAVEA